MSGRGDDRESMYEGSRPTWGMVEKLTEEKKVLKAENAKLRSALASIEEGSAKIPDPSTIFINGKVPLVWKTLNKYDMQDVAKSVLSEVNAE